MPTEDLRERLFSTTARARARPVRGGPPRPGDLFVLKATADLPVEWAILDHWPEKGQLLAVPADQNPLAGSADVEVPAAAPGGPLSLRCRFGAWLDAGLFDPGLRSGSLAPETLAEALRRVRRVEDGTLEPAGLAEEVDAESEYKDWIREVPERARALALAARPAASRMGLWEWNRLAAAVLAFVAVGLGIWVAVLRREVDRLSAPIFDLSAQEVTLGEKTRGRTVLEIPPQAGHVLLTLFVDAAIPPQDGHFEILDAKGREVWRSKPVRVSPAGDFRPVLPRSLLPDGEYRVRIVPEAGGHPLAESRLWIETAQHERKLGDGSEKN
ncbi:MAG: hypothetical protein ACJ76Y_00930 [Thermoanaerobaculia bacterium]